MLLYHVITLIYLLHSMMTLFQLLTYDNVDDTMRISMYGCKNYFEYQNPGMNKYNDLCKENGGGLGWLAPLFFVCFTIVCGFVMMSSLVGLIISSMEQLTDIRNAEIEIWKDVDEIAEAYEMNPASISLSLKLFEAIDKEVKCHLTYRDLQPLMRVAGLMDDQEQLQYYLRVDRDGSGQIEFPEFVEFLAILGFSLGKTALSRKKKEIAAAIGADDEDSVSSTRKLPAPLAVIALELKTKAGSVIDPAAEESEGVNLRSSMSRPNRNAVERKSYRVQSRKVDNHRLKKSFSREPGVDVSSSEKQRSESSGGGYKIMNAIERVNDTIPLGTSWNVATRGGTLRQSKDVSYAVSEFEDMPLDVDHRAKPNPVIVNYSKAANRIAVNSDLVLIDEE